MKDSTTLQHLWKLAVEVTKGYLYFELLFLPLF